ncbi:hypothetical protein E8E12_011285 [Didymella heteroderae]|uniref:Dicer-like protein 2 n=1 Tax=Didymella heteroderae TaxID=1769908 RepID=A0A9P4WZY5_9PLEO|nr:hypothetical protein E8E12_011285 [Didymella heteroderae]
MDDLALLIFDEAHHCTLNHPANRIMTNFYTPRVQKGDAYLPKILGLSASPVMKADATTQSLEQIERNLHATAKTPKKTRSELTRYVHQPELIRVDYRIDDQAHSPLVTALTRAYREYDLMQDPYIKDLLRKQLEGMDVSGQLQRLLLSHKTYCTEQLKALTKKAQDVVKELGPSAADWYLHQCVAKFEKTIGDAEQLLDFSKDEKQHLLEFMRKLPFQEIVPGHSLDTNQVSPKVESLIDVLVSEAQNKPSFTGLVFVEQRAWLAVLSEILATHPRTRDLLHVGTFLGASSTSKRKQMIATLPEPRNQKATLDDFRAGTTNLILATSVLEEGIDVSSCHLVVCFESPKNLKSFVQRRGRARMQESKYFIFMPDAGGERAPESWEALEKEMKKAYLEDMRQSRLAKENEEEEEEGSRTFEVEATGARLTLDDALSHLTHFCSLLGSGPYVDPRPHFKFIETSAGITAEVTLPISVNRAIRKARGKELWRTEKMARKDAAFEAYKALYRAGLVSDNLLPLRQGTDDMALGSHVPDNRPSVVLASPTLDPWLLVAHEWKRKPREYFRTLVEFHGIGQVRLITSTPIPLVDDIRLYWNESEILTVKITKRSTALLSAADLTALRYVCGGLPKAFACVQTLLPLEEWSCIPEANVSLYEAAPADLAVTQFDILESLIEYTFNKKMLLLEALTHNSYTGPNVNGSYDRLEFLGDAVLDYIVITRLYAHNPPLSHLKMHAIQSAMVNAAFLTFTMLETTIAEETISKSTLQPEIHRRVLWQYLRSGSSQMTAIRDAALRQHAEVRERLIHALRHGEEFPWHLLALINAPKFLSDIVESVIGAIYVDSHGDLSACEAFVRRLGILDYLERIIRDNVDCLHPKERLGHIAIEHSVEYVRMPLRGERRFGDLPPSMGLGWRCQVKVGGEEVGGVVAGLNRLYAETVAAWEANEILRRQRLATAESSGEDDVFFEAEEG